MTLVKQRALVFLFPLLLALPFLNRAYFVDDHFFVEIARWIKDNPTRPYDFPVDGLTPGASLSKKEISLRIVNPLLHHFYLAGLMKAGGEREWFLRLGCVLLSCFSALLMFALARRWVDHPLLATLIALATPVHWLTSYSLLIDSTMAFFFLGAVYSTVRFGETGFKWYLFIGGVSMGAAFLTKYTAVLLVPLSLTWVFLDRKNVDKPWLAGIPIVIAGGMLLAYSAVTKSLYGADHLLASSGETLHGFNFGKAAVLLTFLSGGAVAPLMIWGAASKRRSLIAGACLASMTAFLRSPLGGFTMIQAFLFALWLTTSGFVIFLFYAVRNEWKARTDAFLFSWLLGFLAMMIIVMQWVAVRYYMIAVPALAFLCVRIVEISRGGRAAAYLKSALAGTLAIGLMIAYADYRQAESSRFLARELSSRPPAYYFSEAFTMTYVAREGWKPAADPARLSPGDRIVTSEITLPLYWFLRHRVPMRLERTIEYSSTFPIKVMDANGAAGFYASAWGPLPFTISSEPWERFHLFEIIER